MHDDGKSATITHGICQAHLFEMRQLLLTELCVCGDARGEHSHRAAECGACDCPAFTEPTERSRHAEI